MKAYFIVIIGLFLSACAGPDYTPVYFGSPDTGTVEAPPKKVGPGESVHCTIELTANLCVTIKGDNIEVGTDPKDPMCSPTPPIPFEIQGEQVLLKGSDFPDIPVTVDIKGVETPMMINGKGTGDGSDNTAIGAWTPEGDLSVRGFSFYATVLGLTGKIEGIDLTTSTSGKTPDLEPISGTPIQGDGKAKLVGAVKLGHVIDAADKFLKGASMQVVFDGAFDPPPTECMPSGDDASLKVFAITLTETGEVIESESGEDLVLSVSEGTFIAESETDIGKYFEGRRDFKLVNEGKEDLKIKLPQQTGPFHLESGGQTAFVLETGESFLFTVLFKPNLDNAHEPGEIKQPIRIGHTLFQLKGIALERSGKIGLNRINDLGRTVPGPVSIIEWSPLSLPAGTEKAFFQCRSQTCGDFEAPTACESCTPAGAGNCRPYPINTAGRPIDAVDDDCKPVDKESLPMMGIDLSSGEKSSILPSKQTLQIRNNGVREMTITSIGVENPRGSKSTGEFQWLPDTALLGTDIASAVKTTLPVTLPPYRPGFEEQTLFVTVVYLPGDLIGSDGTRAAPGLSVTDRAEMKIVTDTGTETVPLAGVTKIKEVPELLAYLATETGLKPKADREIFFFEKLTRSVRDYAVPVYLKLSDTATAGVRVGKVTLQGADKNHFEWLDSEEKVKDRMPPQGQGKRCSIPVYDAETGQAVDESFDLRFIGDDFDLKPAAFSLSNMPLFGCLNFHRGEADDGKRLFEAELRIETTRLDLQGKPEKNPDGSLQKGELLIPIRGVLEPLKGKYVLRVAQTLFAILNPTNPAISAMPHRRETVEMLEEGHGSLRELNVLTGSLILDPFLEMKKTDHKGEPIGRDSTIVFRAVDTRPTGESYREDSLDDFITLLHDSLIPENSGVFYDYGTEEKPLPDPLRISSWRIFTGSLSYPGPFDPRSPIDIDQCEPIDPCDRDDLKRFTKAGATAKDEGACAFFFASGGHIDSPAFVRARGGQDDLCAHRDEPQELFSGAEGEYLVDGRLTVTNLGLRFWGPNYFLNPYGPLGDVPPMDDVFHIAFTTEVLRPQKEGEPWNRIPDAKLDLNRQEFKINLDDENHINPPMCPNNRKNRTLLGKKYSSWKYLAPLLFKDEEGTVPAGCPEPGNNFSGGTAYLKGRPIDPETGITTLVAVGKFSARDELSLAFKNIPIVIALNAWLCDPNGNEENFEGAKCFDETFNDRDEKAQITFMEK